jgi:hypothetical protein
MDFFLPHHEGSPEDMEKAYQSIRTSIEKQMGPLRSKRYYRISYRHNSKDMVATVGERDDHIGDRIIAIFRGAGEGSPYYICTISRGVLRGGPILASSDAKAIEFQD